MMCLISDFMNILIEAVRKYSNLGWQGYDGCNCTQQCSNKKCKYKVAGKKCIRSVKLCGNVLAVYLNTKF